MFRACIPLKKTCMDFDKWVVDYCKQSYSYDLKSQRIVHHSQVVFYLYKNPRAVCLTCTYSDATVAFIVWISEASIKSCVQHSDYEPLGSIGTVLL